MRQGCSSEASHSPSCPFPAFGPVRQVMPKIAATKRKPPADGDDGEPTAKSKAKAKAKRGRKK